MVVFGARTGLVEAHSTAGFARMPTTRRSGTCLDEIVASGHSKLLDKGEIRVSPVAHRLADAGSSCHVKTIPHKPARPPLERETVAVVGLTWEVGLYTNYRTAERKT